MGSPRTRRPEAVRTAHPRRRASRAQLADHPAQARKLSSSLCALRCRQNRDLWRKAGGRLAGKRGHRAQSPEDCRDHPQRSRLPGCAERVWQFRCLSVAVCRWRAKGECLENLEGSACQDGGIRCHEQSPGKARVQIRRLNYLLCVHAGCRHGKRSHGRLFPLRTSKGIVILSRERGLLTVRFFVALSMTGLGSRRKEYPRVMRFLVEVQHGTMTLECFSG